MNQILVEDDCYWKAIHVATDLVSLLHSQTKTGMLVLRQCLVQGQTGRHDQGGIKRSS